MNPLEASAFPQPKPFPPGLNPLTKVMLQPAHRRVRPSGFTLIELIVVMAVLTVLAGLVLPKLDVFKLKANKASAASNIHGVNRFVAAYKVQHDLFPDGWDSLLDGSGALFSALDPQLTGSGVANPTKLTVLPSLTDDELRSLTRVGITTVFDHTTGGFPADSATNARALTSGGNLALATINAADGDGQSIIQHFYPNSGGVVPAGKKIVVFGLGPRNEMNGDTLHSVPFYANTDQVSFYSRFLVCFEIDDGGGRARLLGTLGADGDRIDEEIADFYEN